MIKFKHFYNINGSGQFPTEEDFLEHVSEFVSREDINTMEVNHAFTHSPNRMLSVFVSYVELPKEVKEATKVAVKEATKKKAKKKATTKKK